MNGTFPPANQTTLQQIIPAYVYQQYSDDDNIQAFNSAYNILAQAYLDWFNDTPLPIYTDGAIYDSLLDWVAAGVYGLIRPSLPSGRIVGIGALNTWALNTLAMNTIRITGSVSDPITTDDTFKRVITWFFFKGDGQNFSVPWLKRRVMRFLIGSAGTAPNIGETYPVSVSFGAGNAVTITITLTSASGITLAIAQIFQAAVQSAAISLPFQFAFSVVIVNDLVATNLTNAAGVLNVSGGAGYPTSATGLPAGAVWSNSGVVRVVPGMTPDPFAFPLFFGVVTAAQLLAFGGGNLPTSNPGVGSNQIWNNGGTVNVA